MKKINCKYFLTNGTCDKKPKNYLGVFAQECLFLSGVRCSDFYPAGLPLPPKPPDKRILKH